MAVLARVHITSQQRLDLPLLLGAESYMAFDFRALVKAFTGSTQPYVLRGLEITGKTGLFVSVSIADCFIMNPLDENGSFYLGEVDAPDLQIELPPSQPFVYLEARFQNVTQAAISAGYWDPLAVTGSSEGSEFTATQNSQNIIEMELTTNTVGFSTDAIPIAVCTTSNSAVGPMADARPDFFRLGRGGASPNPGYKFPWSPTRGEPVTVGTGTGNETSSSFRSRDNTGILNDKGIRSFKEMFDAICTRIAEISGASIWYSNSSVQQYVGGLSLSGIFFDSVGHTLQPKRNFVYDWDGSNLSNTGSEVASWKANYADIEWHLGKSFTSGTDRSYSAVNFSKAVPDGSNVFIVLEREVTKNSANNLTWKSVTPSTTYSDFVTNYDKVVSGVAADFAGIAVGDYIRKDSQGYSQYYRVVALATSTSLFSQTEGVVADNSVVAVKLSKTIDLESIEPLRYFRARYSESDLQVLSGSTVVPSVDYYWLARRRGDFLWLRDHGPLWRDRSWEHLDKAWSKIKLLREYQNLFCSGGGLITFESTPGTNVLQWTDDLHLNMARRNATYTLPAGTATIPDGSCLWVDIPEDDTSQVLTPQVTTLGAVPLHPDDIGYSDRIMVLFYRRGLYMMGLGDMPDLSSGEGSTVGLDLPAMIRARLGIVSETQYINYFSTHIVLPTDDYPTAISRLDATVYSILTDTAQEEIIVVGASPVTTITSTLLAPWNSDPAVPDIQIFVNDVPQTLDLTGGLNQDCRKNSDSEIEFSYALQPGWKVRIRDERTGGGTGGGTGEINTGSNLGAPVDGIGVFAYKFGVDLQFKRLKAGANVTLTELANSIVIDAVGGGGGGGVTAATNLGTISDGEGLYSSLLASTLQFKRIKAGSGVTVTSSTNSVTISAASAGEANTGSNLGATGARVFAQKTGVDLQFRRIIAGTNVTVTENTNDITIAATGGGSGEANTASNLGVSGAALFAQKVGVDLQFRKLIAGSNITLTQNTNDVTIAATTSGEANTGSNLGATGARVFAQKSSVDLQFRRLVAGAGITLTEGTNTITFDVTGGGGGGEANTASNLGTGTGIFALKSGVDLQFKSLKAGDGVSISASATEVTTEVQHIQTRVLNTSTIFLTATGLKSDVDAIVVTKTGNTVAITNVTGTAKLVSFLIHFASGDIASNTNASISYPEPFGSTTTATSLLPLALRTNGGYTQQASTSCTFSNTGGVVTANYTGLTSNQAIAFKLVW